MSGGPFGVPAEVDLVVCFGPGGVGKTTTAAVLAREAARAGRRTLVITVDPARRLADALGRPAGLTGDPVRLSGPGDLWAMALEPSATFARTVQRDLGDDPERAARLLGHPFTRALLASLSRTQEYMAGEELAVRLHDPRFDLVVVDTPPTRQALDLVAASGHLVRFLGHPVVRALAGGSRSLPAGLLAGVVTRIGAAVGAAAIGDAVEFLRAFAGVEAGVRARAVEVGERLRAPGTRIVLVTAPRTETVDETLWLAARLSTAGLRPAAVVVNQVDPVGPGPGADVAAARAATAPDPVLAAGWANLAELQARAEAAAGEVERVRSSLPTVPSVLVPVLDGGVRGAAQLDRLGSLLRDSG